MIRVFGDVALDLDSVLMVSRLAKGSDNQDQSSVLIRTAGPEKSDDSQACITITNESATALLQELSKRSST